VAVFDENRLSAVLEEIGAQWGIPGLGVGIVEDGEIVYARGFGVQSLETQRPVTLDSVFCLASIAKCFVATAVMQLVERGKIALDTSVVQYLPYLRMDDERYRQISIRQLLSHTSGMPDMDESEYVELVAQAEVDDGAAERYVRALNRRKLAAEPGSRFLYSNIAYNVLGDLISKISGQTFEAYMREYVLLGAGMADSTFFYQEVPQDRLAVPHLRSPEMIVNPIYPYHRADSPASFLHSSVVDMCRWGITCLARGTYHGHRILTPASYDLMWTPVAQRGHRPSLREDMGLGWNLGHFEGVRTVSHGGGGFGWTALFVLLPEHNQAAIILCNEESSAHSRAAREVLHALLDREPAVDTVSWMVPINQALQEGGIRAAYARYAEIKDSSTNAYSFDENELLILATQLLSVKKPDLAIDVLKLNLDAFPEHVDSYLALAKLYLQKNERVQAESLLWQVLSIDPDDPTARELLEQAR
jgi:CubicO group peptidase (beta-lactamase class C family)